jgi:predicted nucleic acid-binding protein
MPFPERVLVDTSAFYALASATDLFHEQANATYQRLLDRDQELWTTSYILAETIALVHRRLGFPVLSEFMESHLVHWRVFWVDSAVHEEGWRQLVATSGRGLGFVDWTTVVVSRILQVPVFTFDRAFASQGLSVLPRQ